MKRILLTHGLALVLGVALTLAGVRWWQQPAPATVTQHDNTTTVSVQRPDLRPQDVAPHLTSPVVTPLVQAQAQQGRTVTVVGETSGKVNLTFPGKPECPSVSVPVECVAVVGTDKTGQPTASLNLFQVQPGGERVPLTDAKTTIVAAQPQKPRWRLSAALQAGVGLTSSLTGQRATVALVALPWLRHGQGHAEDSTWALLSPALVTDGKTAEPGILPVSVNIARKIPLLSDVWVSPVVSFDVKMQKVRIGVGISATF